MVDDTETCLLAGGLETDKKLYRITNTVFMAGKKGLMPGKDRRVFDSIILNKYNNLAS